MNKSEQKNPLLCDIETGICETGDKKENIGQVQDGEESNTIKIIYFTDPICSACWGIEPQLRKLKLEYGDEIEIEYRMGGLLPDWSYNSGGISKPADVAKHWDEVSAHYDMPIDGDVWLEDPLNSSYPSSIAFKAAQMQDKKKALLFLREIRELVFLYKKNIAKWEQLEQAAKKVGLNVIKLKNDYAKEAKELFEKDLRLAQEYGVRGFPTLFFIGGARQREILYGAKPYSFFEKALLKLNDRVQKQAYAKDGQSLFAKFHSLTAKEFSILSDTPRTEAEKVLDGLVAQGVLKKWVSKNGAIWERL